MHKSSLLYKLFLKSSLLYKLHPRPVQHTFTCQVLSCPCRIFVSLKTTCLSPFGGVWRYFCQSNMFVPFWRCAQHDILSWHNFHTILELYLFSEVQQHREAVHDLTCRFLGSKFDTSGWLPLVADQGHRDYAGNSFYVRAEASKCRFNRMSTF